MKTLKQPSLITYGLRSFVLGSWLMSILSCDLKQADDRLIGATGSSPADGSSGGGRGSTDSLPGEATGSTASNPTVSWSGESAFTAPPVFGRYDAPQAAAVLKANGATFRINVLPVVALATDSTELTACLKMILDTVTLQVSDTTIAAAIEADASACLKAQYVGSGFNVLAHKAKFKLKSELSCTGGGLSAFAGKKYSELGDLRARCSSGQLNLRTFSGLVYYVKILANNATGEGEIAEIESETISEWGQGNGDPCQADGTLGGLWVYQDHCFFAQRTTNRKFLIDGVAAIEPNGDSWFKVDSLGVKYLYDGANPWPVEGSYLVNINDWTGTVSSRGETQAPNFEIKGQGQVATGDFAVEPAAPAAALRGSALKKVHVRVRLPY